MRILLIDDDEQLMEVLAERLIEQHYAVDIATNGEMGWEFILLFDYDLVVLDWMLPELDGITLCQKIRKEGYKMPIMLLTARDRYTDKVMGLDAGADDYVVKPFNFDELTARIRALLRREIHVSSPILYWQDLSLNPKTYEVKHQNQLIPLTPKEYGLLELFMRHPQQVFTPSAIIDNLWAGEDPPGEEAVRTHIKGLRQKLKKSGMAKDTIQTVYGIGYRLKSSTSSIPKTQNSKKDQSQKITRAWLTFKAATLQRLAILEQLTQAIAENQINQELYTQAKSSAHKLAGSLGSFGFPEGSRISKQIENLLTDDLSQSSNQEQLTKLIASLNEQLHNQISEAKVKNTLDRNISILIIDKDTNYRQQLATEAQKQGMQPYTASDLNQAREIIASEPLAAVLLKIIFPDGEDLEFLQELHTQMIQLPIVTIAESAQLFDRLAIVRQGCHTVLQYPVAPSIAISSVAELVKDVGNGAKILIVDDDPQVLLHLEVSLQPWGFDLTTLSDPTQFWQVLEATQPDALVLDIEMPEINGIELCQVLRSDLRWQKLPVLFLTVHQEKKFQHQAFAIGADDYICKPVVGSELANRILNRLQRNRVMK